MAQEARTVDREIELRAIHSLLTSAVDRFQAVRAEHGATEATHEAEKKAKESLLWLKFDGNKGRWAE